MIEEKYCNKRCIVVDDSVCKNCLENDLSGYVKRSFCSFMNVSTKYKDDKEINNGN